MLARPPLQVGDGRFVVVDELGEGGTAIVYLAYDREERAWCALKALLFKHLDNEEMRRRFNQEATTLGSFDHPNIPRLIAHAPLASPPYMVIELARRGSAMDWLREHGAMPGTMAIEVIDQLCCALEAAHASGVVHRDVKPHNVLLFEQGVYKLTDFGIARVAENTSFTATGTQIGTFSFMAPEQRSDTKSVGPRADIYSVGASLFTLLTGRTSAELFLADPDDDLLNEVPRPLRDVILRATRYRPEDRYPTIGHVREALRDAAESLSPGASRPPPRIRDRTPLPRSPPETLPPGRRFSDLERSLARDSAQATFVPAAPRHSLSRSLPPPAHLLVPPVSLAPRGPSAHDSLKELDAAPHETLLPDVAPHGPPVDDPLRRWLAYGTGAGALAVAAMALVITVGALQVWTATADADAAGRALVTAMRADPELGNALGERRLAYERAYDAILTADEEQERVQAALAGIAVLDEWVERREFSVGHTVRLRHLRDARDSYLRAHATWVTISSTFPGSWAVAIGIARHPGSAGR